jgi:Ribbon-helix-helix protein, copG family
MLNEIMRRSNIVEQKKRGRPPTGQTPFVGVRLSSQLIARVDAWAAKDNGALSRSEALRRLVELGLTVKAPKKSPRSIPIAKLNASNDV